MRARHNLRVQGLDSGMCKGPFKGVVWGYVTRFIGVDRDLRVWMCNGPFEGAVWGCKRVYRGTLG